MQLNIKPVILVLPTLQQQMEIGLKFKQSQRYPTLRFGRSGVRASRRSSSANLHHKLNDTHARMAAGVENPQICSPAK